MKLTTGYKKPIASSGTDAQEQSSNNSYLLLAGGGHKALSELVSPADLTNYVTIGSDQTITGVKTFSQAINADITGNADTLDNYHASSFYENGYVMFKHTIDASGLDNNTWYPVIISIGNSRTVRIEVIVSLNSGTTPSWSNHELGFSVRKIWEVNGSGWGTNRLNRRILESDYSYASEDPVRGIGQLGNSSTEFVYVRGGGKYYFFASHNAPCTLCTTTYTIASQSIGPTTTTPDAIGINVGNYCNNAGNAYTLDGYHASDFATAGHTHSDYVTALGTNDIYLTWTKNGSTSNVTVPYAESAGDAGTLGGWHKSAFATANHTHTTSEITNFPTIGNGALHIKVNGTELTPEGGIFTANKGDNSTINITVPTAESIEESTLNKLGDKVVLKNGFTTELAKEMAEVISEKNTEKKLIFKFANPATSLECNPDILSVNYIKVGDYYRLNVAGSFELNGFNFHEQKLQDNYNPVLYSVSSGTINNVELSAKKTGMLYFRLSDQQVSPNGAYGPVVFELSVFVESLSTDYNDGIYGELNIAQFYS